MALLKYFEIDWPVVMWYILEVYDLCGNVTNWAFNVMCLAPYNEELP